MSKKMEFVERASEPGAKLSVVCREFGISRQTGYKWLQRFREEGFEGLEERSRRPKSSPLASPEEIVAAVLGARDAHPTWGPKKLEHLLRRRFGEEGPSQSTIARMLRRFGRVRKRRARRPISLVDKAPTIRADKPNDVWTIDFKGWWRTEDGLRCEPLTVRDGYSRYLLAVTLGPATGGEVRRILEALFRKHGLPRAIQCDNGTPFISVQSRGGLSRLSAWWVSMGIQVVRSRPACPQDNGGHERMHLDIANDIESAPAATRAAQQRIIDRWRQEFNHVRPHEALDGKTPAELYRPSERRYRRGAIPATYPPHYPVKRVAADGCLYMHGEAYFVSRTLAGYRIALQQLDGLRWKVWFYNVDCGYLEILPQRFDALASEDFVQSLNRQEKPVTALRARGQAASSSSKETTETVCV